VAEKAAHLRTNSKERERESGRRERERERETEGQDIPFKGRPSVTYFL
jgi:hypothetical protein